MKRLKQHWTAGPLACLLSAALTLPVLLAWLLAAPQAAHAQTLNRLPTWAVVTFVNRTGYGGPEVGTEASDGFVVELGKSNKYDVLPRAQTEQSIADLGLVEPLDTIGLQKLARAMEADAVATGEVASVSFGNSPRRATVTVVVKVVDRVSGELINGAVAKGASTPRPIATNDDDSLVNEAIEKADFEAVRQISAFNLARATVLIHPDPAHVTLNEGSQEGLYPGLNMLVTRNGTEVGRIQVSTVEPDEANATVTDQGLGINTQDIATAIYSLPSLSTAPNGDTEIGHVDHNVDSSTTGSSSARSFFTGPLGAIVAGALGVGLLAVAVGHGNGSSSGPNAIGNGQASVGPAVLTFNNISGIAIPAENPVDAATFIPTAIQINFGPGNIQGSDSLREYHVYRDPEPELLANPTNFNVPTAQTAALIPLPAFSPAASPQYDSIQDLRPIFVQKPDPTNNTNTPIQGNFFMGVNGLQLPLSGTGLLFGDRVRYRIEILYTIPNLNTTNTNPGGGFNNGTGPLIYSLSEPIYSNFVSYLDPPLLSETDISAYPHTFSSATSPDNDVFAASTGPTNIVVTFHAVDNGSISSGGGSNSASNSVGVGLDYCLDFSTDRNFSPGSTLRFTQNAPFQAGQEQFPRGTTGGPNIQFGGSANPNSTTIDLTSSAAQAKLGNLANSHATVYVRAGVHDSRDSDDSFIYSTLDGARYTDPVSRAYAVPSSLTPGGGTANGSARAHVISAAAMAAAAIAATGVRTPGSLIHLGQRSSPRPAFNPSAVVHAPSIDFQTNTPAPASRHTAPVRPSTPGH